MTRKRSCTKLNTYPTWEAVHRAMRKIPPTRTGVVPVRAYWCGRHKGFHYTTKI